MLVYQRVDPYQHMIRCEVPWSEQPVHNIAKSSISAKWQRSWSATEWKMMCNPSKPMVDHLFPIENSQKIQKTHVIPRFIVDNC